MTNRHRRYRLSTCVFLTLLPAVSMAEADLRAPTVQVRGILPSRLETVPGSFDVIDRGSIEQRAPFSIKEALDNIGGVNVVDEDSLGLGLNIGIRGLDPRRTSRTLLLEDGMPLFLGPYGDPSAHYSTPLERVERIEVVKGSGQILYGPQTVGGMINFVTRPIPRTGIQGTVTGAVGNQGYRSLYGNIGYGNEKAGFMIDALKRQGDGVRENHEFDVQDLAVKGRFQLTDTHEIRAKLSRYEEASHISETGLGETEYANNPFQAPTGRQDRFNHERTAVQLQHIWRPDVDTTLSTQIYHVDSSRASFRQINEPGGNNGLSELERCPGGVDTTNLSNGVVCGGRWRPREFSYSGIEPRLDFAHNLFGIASNAVVGFRYHVEDQTREQYRGNTAGFQNLDFAKANSLPRERILIDVRALAYYAQNTFNVGDFAITPGLRVEDVKTETVVERANGTSGYASLTNSRTVVLPGLGLAWNGLESTTVFAGVHRGFAPPRPSRDLDGFTIDPTQPEKSTNWELGMRSRQWRGLDFGATAFLTDFDNIVINNGAGRFVNAGESRQAGVELSGRMDLAPMFSLSHDVYLIGSYTNLVVAKFRKDGLNPDDGIVENGRLPYAPRQMASLSAGYRHPVGVDARIGFVHRSEQLPDAPARDCSVEGGPATAEPLSGVCGTIPAYTILNATVNYRPAGSQLTLFLSAQNLTNRQYLASRVDGMVAGRPRLVFAGARYDF